MDLRSEDERAHNVELRGLRFLDGEGCDPGESDPEERVEITKVTLERHEAKTYRLLDTQTYPDLRFSIPPTEDTLLVIIEHEPVQTHLSCRWHHYRVEVEVDGQPGVFDEAVRVIQRPPHPKR